MARGLLRPSLLVLLAIAVGIATLTSRERVETPAALANTSPRATGSADRSGPAADSVEPGTTSDAPVPESSRRSVSAMRAAVGVFTGGTDSLADFLPVEIHDSAFVDASGIFPTLDELAHGGEVDLFSGETRWGAARLVEGAPLDSLLRVNDSGGCAIAWSLPVSSRRVPSGSAQSWDGWTFGVAAGTVPWQSETAGQDAAHLTRLASDVLSKAPLDRIDSTATPFVVTAASTSVMDSAEFLFAMGERMWKRPDSTIVAQRVLVIAERVRTGHAGEFAVGHTEVRRFEFMDEGARTDSLTIDDVSDELTYTTARPFLVGRSRTPALVLGYDHKDGGGGALVARLAPGVWREVVSWYSGCQQRIG